MDEGLGFRAPFWFVCEACSKGQLSNGSGFRV
jgi:hypothetical protein